MCWPLIFVVKDREPELKRRMRGSKKNKNIENRARVMQENVVSNMTGDGYACGPKEMLPKRCFKKGGEEQTVCVREGHQAKKELPSRVSPMSQVERPKQQESQEVSSETHKRREKLIREALKNSSIPRSRTQCASHLQSRKPLHSNRAVAGLRAYSLPPVEKKSTSGKGLLAPRP